MSPKATKQVRISLKGDWLPPHPDMHSKWPPGSVNALLQFSRQITMFLIKKTNNHCFYRRPHQSLGIRYDLYKLRLKYLEAQANFSI
jgi:hypothetical protein